MQHTEKWISIVWDGQIVRMKQDEFVQICMKALSERGIDISDDGYYQNEKFKDFENAYIAGEVFIPLTWWIEKNLIGQERLIKIYGIYAMGIEHEFSDEELMNSSWMEYLIDKYPGPKIKTKEEFTRTRKDVEQYVSRLIKRLKKVNFNIDEFEQSEAKKEKVKLLYFLYCFEFDNKVEIGPFLSNPTLENVDNICVGDKTRNGELMACLKNNLLKEISLKYAKNVKKTLYDIPTQFEEQILYIRYIAFSGNHLEIMKKIKEELEWLVSIVKKDIDERYQDSLLETFYLKLSLHEIIGRENDFLDVFNRDMGEKYKPSDYLISQYRELDINPLKINWHSETEKNILIEEYFDNNRKKLAQCVFGKGNINQNEHRKLDRAVKGLKKYLDFVMSNTKACLLEELNGLYIISFLQEFIFMDKNEKVENKFYRYMSGDRKTLNSEILNEEQAFRKNQIVWLEKVNSRYYANSGIPEIYEMEKEVEKSLDSLLLEVYKSNSLQEMKFFSGLVLSYIKAFVGNRNIVSGYWNILMELAQERKYHFDTMIEEEIFQSFLGFLERFWFNDFLLFLADSIDKAESTGEERSRYECKVDIAGHNNNQLNAFLKFTICPEKRLITLEDCRYKE